MIQAKFRALAPMMRPLLAELELRRETAEYEQLLADCHSIYIDVRIQLIGPIVAMYLAAQQTATDVVTFVRDPRAARIDSGGLVAALADHLCEARGDRTPTLQTRTASVYLERVCLDEHQLFCAFFEPEPVALQCVCDNEHCRACVPQPG